MIAMDLKAIRGMSVYKGWEYAVSDIICKHCEKQVAPGTKHHCKEMQIAGLPPGIVPSNPDQNDDSCFITSAVAGYATGSSLVGTIIGGDPLGAIAGAALSPGDDDDRAKGSEDAVPDPEPEPDTSDDSDDGDDSDDD